MVESMENGQLETSLTECCRGPPVSAEACNESCGAADSDGRVCQCGGRCEERGDCCLDHDRSNTSDNVIWTSYRIIEALSGNAEIFLQYARLGDYRCESVPISGLLAVRHLYMISSCPPGYQASQTGERCSRSHSQDYDYLSDVPVTSLNTGRVYRYN